MLRSHNCEELRLTDAGNTVTLCGWVQRRRDFGGMSFIDLRDRYGITQLSFNEDYNVELLNEARSVSREFVVKITGEVTERSNKNPNLATGDIEIVVNTLEVLNPSLTPPFTIEDDTDGGEELRLKYRYLDIRRNPVKEKLLIRHAANKSIRNFLNGSDFVEVETPYLIKSTPEGARDFVVPSRLNEDQFYALPQSPQTFKQLLMVSGLDRYYQVVKCFRDEDFRSDRQPEFTQIDCEMTFVEQSDILGLFEKMVRNLFAESVDYDLGDIPVLTYADAIKTYGSDKPDMRFDMTFKYLTDVAKGYNFGIFDNAESIIAVNASGAASLTRKQIDAITNYVKRPQVGAKGLIYCRVNEDGSLKSSVDKFFDQEALAKWVESCNAKPGDLIFVMSGDLAETQKQMNDLRLHLGDLLDLRTKDTYKACWVVDFPLLEWDEETGRYHAMHHPFTSPKQEDFELIETDPKNVRANAYDMAINGMEVGGGSIRIHDKELQQKMFDLLGFTKEKAKAQFGFLMNAFEYGAPPHGGIAFGFDRLCAILTGTESIRDVIAFPKNNMGRDIMIDAPSPISKEQRDELGL